MPTTLSIDDIRAHLEARAARLREEIAAAQARSGEADTHEVLDRKEEAEGQARAAIDSAGIERDLAELRDIEHARQRLAEGSYGLCADCGDPIEPARLLAQPTALRCTECQRNAERRAVKRR